MSHPALGRVLDPEALDGEAGARGLCRIVVPSGWLEAPCEIELLVPSRLPCARCDGGGCDGCGRSGAVRAPREETERVLSASLPAVAASGVALRLSRPFGPEAEIVQLVIEVRAGEEASAGVTRRAPPAPLALASSGRAWPVGLALVIAAIGAVLAMIFGR
ncbi:MAG: hypothetical protein U0359_07495 [Byssovorax sp.]